MQFIVSERGLGGLHWKANWGMAGCCGLQCGSARGQHGLGPHSKPGEAERMGFLIELGKADFLLPE